MVSLFLFIFVTMGKFTFRTGKHKGKTLDWVEDNDPSYIVWCEENRPEMLKEPKKKESKDEVIPEYRPKPLTPNYDFDNEVGDFLPTDKKETKKDNDETESEWNF